MKIKPVIEAFLIAIIPTSILLFSVYSLHFKSINSLKEELKIGLLSNATSAATTVDGDRHALLDSETPRDDSLYTIQVAPLEDIRQSIKNIRYIYTNIIVEDKVYFMLNPSPQNDNDGDGMPDLAPALWEEYNQPSPALLRALKEQVPTVSDVYYDQWGNFLSAYAPFYNRNGEFVGTLGLDLELTDFYDRIEPLKAAFKNNIIMITSLGIVIGLLFWRIRRSYN